MVLFSFFFFFCRQINHFFYYYILNDNRRHRVRGTRVVIFHGSERYERGCRTRPGFVIGFFRKFRFFFVNRTLTTVSASAYPHTFFSGAGSLRPRPPIVSPRVGVLSLSLLLSLLSLLLLLLLLLLMLYHYLWAAAATPVQAVSHTAACRHIAIERRRHVFFGHVTKRAVHAFTGIARYCARYRCSVVVAVLSSRAHLRSRLVF